jgi:ADP-heptose:LPS heptosyltransferase
MTFLVIKLGALGDFVQAIAPFSAIRNYHNGARIVLLTTEAYKDLAEALGFFDEVWVSGRPGNTNISAWLELRRSLVGGNFQRVYDLQTSDRSSFYRCLFWPAPAPEWSGIAWNCSHPHKNPKRDKLHTFERQAEQLHSAGITFVPPVNLSALNFKSHVDKSGFGLIGKYALLAPLGAASRPFKRWPPNRFASVARFLLKKDIIPVFLGTESERKAIKEIIAECPGALNFAGKTSILDLVALSFGAMLAIGNDTGPMHITASTGCSSVILFSSDSDPELCGQRGPLVTILRKKNLIDISVTEVIETLAL